MEGRREGGRVREREKEKRKGRFVKRKYIDNISFICILQGWNPRL